MTAAPYYAKWTDDEVRMLIELYNNERSINMSEILQRINEKHGNGRKLAAMTSRLYMLRQEGRVGYRPATTPPNAGKPVLLWTDDEDELLWDLHAKRQSSTEITPVLNAKFGRERSAASVERRLRWLKNRAKAIQDQLLARRRLPAASATKPAGKPLEAPVGARNALVLPLPPPEPAPPPVPVPAPAPDAPCGKRLRLVFEAGAVELIVEREIPQAAKELISQLVLLSL